MPLLVDLLDFIFDNNRTCPALSFGSTLHLSDGCLETSIQLPGYLSLGETRGLAFSYLSQRAYPIPILPFHATLPKQAAIPDTIRYELRSFGGVNGSEVLQTVVDKSSFTENQDESFRGAIAIGSGSGFGNLPIGPFVDPAPTGIYPWTIRLTNQYGSSAVSTDVSGRYPVVNEQASPIGAGWGLAGLQRIYQQDDGAAFLVNGDGQTINFRSASSIIPIISSLTLFSSDSSGRAIGGQVWNTQGSDGIWVLGVSSNESSSLPLLNNTDPTDPSFTSVAIPIEGSNNLDLYAEPTFPFSTPNYHFGLNIFFDNSSIPGISAIGQLGSSIFRPNSSSNTIGLTGFNIAVGSNSLSYTVAANIYVSLTGFAIPGISGSKNRVGAGQQFGAIGSNDGIVNIELKLSAIAKN